MHVHTEVECNMRIVNYDRLLTKLQLYCKTRCQLKSANTNMTREPTRTETTTPHISASSRQNHEQGLDLADVEQLLYTASSGDTVRLERALFGQQVADIGLHPDVLVVNQIQDEVIRTVFQLVTRAVKEGRREEVAGSVLYLLHEIGEKVVVVLAQAKQYHKSSRATLQQGRKWWQLKGQTEKRHEADHGRIDEVTATIADCRTELMGAVYESFLPELHGKEANELKEFLLLRDKLVTLHALAISGKSENYSATLTRAGEIHTVVSGMLYPQGHFYSIMDDFKDTISQFRDAAARTPTVGPTHLRNLFETLDHRLFLLLKEYDEKVEEHLGPKVRAYLNGTGTADSR